MFLQKFTESPTVPRQEIERLASDPHYSMETVRAALSGIATHNQRKGVYEFKESPDTGFLAAHPEVRVRVVDDHLHNTATDAYHVSSEEVAWYLA